MASKPVDFDPACDPDNPVTVSFEEVSAAAYRIQSGIVKTPCKRSRMSDTYGMEIYLKNEFLQYTGCFKERGARNAMLQLSPQAKQRGVVAASLGNHSQGVSYHGQLLKIPTTVVMPVQAPLMKVEKCRQFGANVVVFGNNIAESKYHALELAKAKGLTYINGFDHPHVIAGQGTIGLEILDKVPDVDAVIIPVGGGSLASGIAIVFKHLKPQALVYGVETDNCASMRHSFLKGGPTYFQIAPTLADGLAVPTVGFNSFACLKPLLDKLITVNEDWVARAIVSHMENARYIVEGAGASPIAAIMAGLVPELAGKKVVCVCSGGNIDTTLLGRCLDRGMAAEQRLVKFSATVSDRNGGIAELTQLLTDHQVSIKDIMQERAWIVGDMFSVTVNVICETRGPEHTAELRNVIAQTYKRSTFAQETEEHTRAGCAVLDLTKDRRSCCSTGQKPQKLMNEAAEDK